MRRTRPVIKLATIFALIAILSVLMGDVASADGPDLIPPTTTATAKNGDGSSYTFGLWTNQDITVTLTATDIGGAGVATTYYTIDGGDAIVYGATPFTLSTSGAHQITYRSVDNANNSEAVNTQIVGVDKTAPVTSFLYAWQGNIHDNIPYTSGEWINTSAVAKFVSSDVNGSGIYTVGMSMNGDDPVYTTPGYFEILPVYGTDVSWDTEGRHQFVLWAIDAMGNIEPRTMTFTINIDLTDPTATYSFETASGSPIQPDANGWFNQPVRVVLSCSDPQLIDETAGSGIASCPTKLIDTDGANQSVNLTVADNAGNTHVVSVTGINIDATSPVTIASGLTVDGPYTWSTWANQTVEITLSGSDEGGSNLATTFYSIDDGSPQMYGSAFNVSAEGIHTISFWSKDGAGNSETPQSVEIWIDKTAPVNTYSIESAGGSPIQPNANGWFNQPVRVVQSCSDPQLVDGTAGSGIADCPSELIDTDGTNQSVNLTARDNAGNTHPINVTSINIDTTLPVITYSAHQSTYAIIDHVTITCTASDVPSGIATSTCQNIDEPAYNLGVGEHTLNASATDLAGNIGAGSATFTVEISGDDLCTLTGEMANNRQTARQLCAPLRMVDMAERMHNERMKTSAINSYLLLVKTQGARSLTANEASVLIRLAGEL